MAARLWYTGRNVNTGELMSKYLISLRRAGIVGILFALLMVIPVGAIAVGGIGGRPANPDPDNPRTQSIFIMTLDKGETGTDEVLVVNNSGEEQTIYLYAVDGIVTNTGSYTCEQESDAKTDLGKWITLSKSEVTLADSKNTRVPFTVTMPRTADVGEHNGCIVFETKDTSETATANESGGVSVKTRQAIRVVATVPGALNRDIVLEDFAVAEAHSKPVYNVSLSNVGNVSADVEVTVRVTSLFKNEIYTNGGGYPVLPDTQLDLSFAQEDTPMFGGLYAAEATIQYAADVTELGTEGGDMITKSGEQKLVFIPPTLLGGTILFVLTLAIAFVATKYVRKQLHHKRVTSKGDTHIVKKGDTIQSIAEQHSMSWKHVATVNKIKAPYVLEEGQVLHVSTQKAPKKK